MVAKYADWLFLDYDKSAADVAGVEASLRHAIEAMSKRAAKYGRKVRYAFNPFVAFGTSQEAAVERAKRLLTPDEPDADVRKMMSRVGPAMKSGCMRRQINLSRKPPQRPHPCPEPSASTNCSNRQPSKTFSASSTTASMHSSSLRLCTTDGGDRSRYSGRS